MSCAGASPAVGRRRWPAGALWAWYPAGSLDPRPWRAPSFFFPAQMQCGTLTVPHCPQEWGSQCPPLMGQRHSATCWRGPLTRRGRSHQEPLFSSNCIIGLSARAHSTASSCAAGVLFVNRQPAGASCLCSHMTNICRSPAQALTQPGLAGPAAQMLRFSGPLTLRPRQVRAPALSSDEWAAMLCVTRTLSITGWSALCHARVASSPGLHACLLEQLSAEHRCTPG